MQRRIATAAAALAVLALLWTSTVVAFSRCAFACDMEADQPSCPLCEKKQPADHAQWGVAIDRSCCDKEFKTSQVSVLGPVELVAPSALALAVPPLPFPLASDDEPASSVRSRGPPGLAPSLQHRRTVVLLL